MDMDTNTNPQHKEYSMSYAWTITVDTIADMSVDMPTEVGTVGPRNAVLGHDEIIGHKDRQSFRMYDDDGNHYYSGFLIGGDGFEPLDDYGTPNAGCTEIKYREPGTGKYITL